MTTFTAHAPNRPTMPASRAGSADPVVSLANPRGLEAVSETRMVSDGDGVPIRRVLPSRVATFNMVDPFLLLDEYRVPPPSPNGGGGFPPHPHRGFEIVTYLLEGTEKHMDSAGHTTLLRTGGAQRITTGSGMWHAEESDTGVRGLQLWVNLAQADKRVAPSYRLAEPEELPVRAFGDAHARIIAGEGSPLSLITPATYHDVVIQGGGAAVLPVPTGWQGFVYVLSGAGVFGPDRQQLQAGQFAALGAGDSLPVVAAPGGTRFMLGAALPHREPVRWNGPYVD